MNSELVVLAAIMHVPGTGKPRYSKEGRMGVQRFKFCSTWPAGYDLLTITYDEKRSAICVDSCEIAGDCPGLFAQIMSQIVLTAERFPYLDVCVKTETTEMECWCDELRCITENGGYRKLTRDKFAKAHAITKPVLPWKDGKLMSEKEIEWAIKFNATGRRY